VEKVPLGCGPLSGTAPVNIPVSFRSPAVQSAGVGGFSLGPLSCSFSKWTAGAAAFWVNFRNCSPLLHT
jgi:hypothetical protein